MYTDRSDSLVNVLATAVLRRRRDGTADLAFIPIPPSSLPTRHAQQVYRQAHIDARRRESTKG